MRDGVNAGRRLWVGRGERNPNDSGWHRIQLYQCEVAGFVPSENDAADATAREPQADQVGLGVSFRDNALSFHRWEHDIHEIARPSSGRTREN